MSVTPFRVDTAPAVLDDLRDRLRATRWPEPETVDDWSQGVPLDYLRSLCEYWAEQYHWPTRQARLNTWPQYRTTVDGLGIHFIHARSPHPDAMPLILTHGWPGSVVEFTKVLGPLTDPVAHGGRAADAFHVVCPSLPGYGFSDKPPRTGWGVERIADTWAELMARLGYRRFGAAGSDWGTSISTLLALRHPELLTGIHLVPPLAAPDTSDTFTDAERDALARLKTRQATGDGYSVQQSTRPQTIGYGLVDSPVALCAWLVEKLWEWTDHDGDLHSVLSRDEVLDNIMLYWLPGTGASAARLYWESIRTIQSWFTESTPDTIAVPAGCSVFPAELPHPSRRWAKRRFTDIRYWGEPSRGGHFAAFEQPESFVAELRAFFSLVRGGEAT
ncbi:alpha/beta fold hydrolase [Stackebrandtia nassauensis]|uniref:Epoxide hydrolase domain protein n=1 Tax=Stackebrandtia nassauensis (strain DSM 44728 / CIP 108903 / NRRL B-16338 / NBRC 102104 / LLR-40K-21) TaxID=446470 RepID=D3PUF9_STANL|nr:alpha/beta fold hydrolase [Stackebrandtia nassauensis]ADD42972.1 Epoxide hydrolase domain protein [Stackebrandtia nassauensis DSM 44728]